MLQFLLINKHSIVLFDGMSIFTGLYTSLIITCFAMTHSIITRADLAVHLHKDTYIQLPSKVCLQ